MYWIVEMCAADMFFFFKQKTAYEMRISDWSSDVCSSDLDENPEGTGERESARHDRCLRCMGGKGAEMCRPPGVAGGRPGPKSPRKSYWGNRAGAGGRHRCTFPFRATSLTRQPAGYSAGRQMPPVSGGRGACHRRGAAPSPLAPAP